MRSLLFSLLCFGFAFTPLRADPLPLVGNWDGSLDAGAAQLRLVLHIKADSIGGYTATLDSVDQGANGIPVEKVSFEGNTLKLDIPAIHASYEGSLDKEGKTLTGKWTQAAPLPLTFKKRSATEKAATPSAIDGSWQGLLVAGEQKLRIALQISTGADGALGVLFVSLDQGPSSVSGKMLNFYALNFEFKVPPMTAP